MSSRACRAARVGGSLIEIEVDIRDRALPVRDQGARPTCLAHAFSASHEVVLGDGTYRSPEYLHWFTPAGSFTGAALVLRDHGQPTEIDCPYRSAAPSATWRPPALTTLRRDHAEVPVSAAAIKAVLRSGNPAVLGLSLPQSFIAVSAPWIVSAPGTPLAHHAVVAVGIGRVGADSFVLIRNSWGRAWADSGHAWLSDAFLEQHLHHAAVPHPEVYLGDFH